MTNVKDSNYSLFIASSPTLKQSLVAISAFIVFFVISKLNLILNFSTKIIGGTIGDASIYIWLAKNFSVSNVLNFETNGFYPYSQSLAFSDNWIFPSLVINIFQKFNLNFITSYNLHFVFISILAAYFFFLLLFYITNNFITSISIGTISLTFAPIQNHLGHPQLQSYWIIPAIILFLFKWTDCRNIKNSIFLALTSLLGFFSSVYLWIFSSYLILLYLIIIKLFRTNDIKIKNILILAICFIAIFFPFFWAFLPYLNLNLTFGDRFYYEAFTFRAMPISYLDFGNFSLLSKLLNFAHSEAKLGVGFIILCASIWCLYKNLFNKKFKNINLVFIGSLLSLLVSSHLNYGLAYCFSSWLFLISLVFINYLYSKKLKNLKISFISNQEIILFLTWILLWFLIFSLGPVGEQYDYYWSPFKLFFEYFPAFSGIRATARFGLISSIILLLITYFYFSVLSSKKRLSNLSILSITALIILENLTFQYPLEPTNNPPLAVTELPNNNDVVIALPYGGELNESSDIKSYFKFTTINNTFLSDLSVLKPSVKSINGFTGVKTKLVKTLPVKLFDFPSVESIRTLSSFVGLNKIIILPEFFTDKNSNYNNPNDLLIELQKLKLDFNDIKLFQDKSLIIELNSNLNLSAPIELLSDASKKLITCSIESNNLITDICNNILISQIGTNDSVAYRCNESEKKLSIFPNKINKPIVAAIIRVSLNKNLKHDTFLNNCN
jgi:hypothetical protein